MILILVFFSEFLPIFLELTISFFIGSSILKMIKYRSQNNLDFIFYYYYWGGVLIYVCFVGVWGPYVDEVFDSSIDGGG